MNAEYRKRIRKVKPAVRGYYAMIATLSGMSIDTVRSVMTFRFRNDAVLEVAEKIAHGEYTNVEQSTQMGTHKSTI